MTARSTPRGSHTPPAAGPIPPGASTWILPALGILALTAIAYMPACRNGFIWDDDQYVSENRNLIGGEGLLRIWFEPRSSPQYYPVVFTTFWLEHLVWGLRPFGYHLVNVLLHAANAILLWRILAGLRVPGALFAGLLFALHPVHVESVAWITERKNVLSGCFYLAALGFYLRACGLACPDAAQPPAPSSPRAYVLSLALFGCALLSKSVTATLPAAILVIIWWKRGRITRADVRPLLPFFAIGMVAGLTTAWLEREHVGAEGREWNLSPVDRGLIAGRALWFYLGKLAWPHPLIFIYPRWTIDARQVWQFALPVGFLVLVAILWMARERIGRGPLATALLFAGTLFPALGFLNVYPMRFSWVADHFQYLASIAPLALFAVACARFGSSISRHAVAVLTLCVAVLLGGLTWRQCRIYRDEETLWKETLARNDRAWIAHNNLATRYATAGDLDAAIRHLTTALDAYPYHAEGQNNLAMMLLQTGRPADALAHVETAIRLDPRISAAQSNLGLVLVNLGRNDEATDAFRKSIELQPGNAAAHYNLGCVLLALGDVEAALVHLRKAADIDPADAQTQERLQAALAEQTRRTATRPAGLP